MSHSSRWLVVSLAGSVLALAGALASPAAAATGVQVVQQVKVRALPGSNPWIHVNFNQTTQAGNTLLITLTTRGPSYGPAYGFTSTVDDAGNAWYNPGGSFARGTSTESFIQVAPNAQPATGVDLYFSAGVALPVVANLFEISGLSTTNPIDSWAFNTGTGTTGTVGPAAPSHPGTLAVGVFGGNVRQAIVPASPWIGLPQVELGSHVIQRTAYRGVSTANPVSLTATWSASMGWSGGFVLLNPA
jgi:hypothetical protein